MIGKEDDGKYLSHLQARAVLRGMMLASLAQSEGFGGHDVDVSSCLTQDKVEHDRVCLLADHAAAEVVLKV